MSAPFSENCLWAWFPVPPSLPAFPCWDHSKALSTMGGSKSTACPSRFLKGESLSLYGAVDTLDRRKSIFSHPAPQSWTTSSERAVFGLSNPLVKTRHTLRESAQKPFLVNLHIMGPSKISGKAMPNLDIDDSETVLRWFTLGCSGEGASEQKVRN